MKKAYLGIDIGSISTKGVIIDEEKNILAGIYLWTEGNPMGAAKKVIAALGEKIDQNEYKVVAAGTTGSARKLVGAMCNASIVKNEITAHAVGTTTLHPDVRSLAVTMLAVGRPLHRLVVGGGTVCTRDRHRLPEMIPDFLQQGHKLIVNKDRVTPILAAELLHRKICGELSVPVLRIRIGFNRHCYHLPSCPDQPRTRSWHSPP